MERQPLKVFPDHWNGWQKGAVIVAGLIFAYWAFSMVSFEIRTVPANATDPTAPSSRSAAPTAAAMYEVRYIITTQSAQYVDLVYNNATGGTERRESIQISGYKPTEFTYQMARGEHAYVAIYTRHDASRTNHISCELLVDGQRLDFTEVSGPSALADCSGIVGR